MTLQKIKHTVRIVLALNFILIALSVIFMKFQVLQLDFEHIHIILGLSLLVIGTVHIILQSFFKKPKH